MLKERGAMVEHYPKALKKWSTRERHVLNYQLIVSMERKIGLNYSIIAINSFQKQPPEMFYNKNCY